MARHSDNARESIIDAAERVVIEAGAGKLTFEAVASKAGISRGGLLHHFPDKESLLKAMLDRFKKHMDESRMKMKMRNETSTGPEREAVVYVKTCLAEDIGKYKHVTAAILASGAHSPELLDTARSRYRQTLVDLTKDGLSFERAAVITLATQGLRLMEVLSVSPFNDGERRKIVKELLSLAELIP